MRHPLLFGLGTALASAVAAGATLGRRYRREMREIEDGLDGASRTAHTKAGDIEYGRLGEGEPVLVIHGAGGGFDQGLALGADLFGPDFGVIAPSRFGYLKSPVPARASPADQADAFAALLDTLGIGAAVVVGVSAGAPSAIEMALRHPRRTRALILVVPRAFAPGGVEVSAPAESAAMLRLVMAAADFAFWLATKVARARVVRFLGVPPELEARASPADRARVGSIMRQILPLSRRLAGLRNDSATHIGPWPLEGVKTPTLVMSAEDDLYGTPAPARYTAEHISGAEFVLLPLGGHLLVGQGDAVRRLVRDFLHRRLGSMAAAA